MYNFSIIKNWSAELIAEGLQLHIKFDYISLVSGIEFYNFDKTFTELETSSEFIITIHKTLGTLQIQSPFVVVPTSEEVIAWITQGFVLEEYFIKADEIWSQEKSALHLPKIYSGNLSEEPVKSEENFRSGGKNFPGSAITNGELIPNFPGIRVGTTQATQKSYPSIAEYLTSSFTDAEVKLGGIMRTSWETKFGENSGTDFSSNLLGLAREDYNFIEKVPQLRKDVVNRALHNNTASNTVFLTTINGQKVVSLNTVEDFRYSLVVKTPSDLALDLVTGISRPIEIYAGNSIEGTNISHSSGVTIELQTERYLPLIKVTTLILATDFKPGFRYEILPAQPLPTGWISTSATTGRLPTTGIRNWNYRPIDNGQIDMGPVTLWQAKTTRHSVEFLFRLYKLRKGVEYNTTTDRITTGIKNFGQLELETFETLVVGDNAKADKIIGYNTNLVFVKLPFDYKRDSLEWNLAQEICEAFLSDYAIGYNEFVADFSVVGEPIFSVGVSNSVTPVAPFTLQNSTRFYNSGSLD